MEFRELDSAGNLVATYVASDKRLDIVAPERRANSLKQLWQYILAIFLPAGYPHSVTSDYMKYQIYDSLQAFSSSIAGLLSSRAVLEGVGVGDASASPTAAIILSIIQDSAGRIATILFAHRLGSALEPECKMWRLAADIFNDIAMILDCLSPAFPKTPRVFILSASSVLRALCGVAAGSAKASLSAHFAKWGNIGELNAKDSSQETVISLLGMLAGSVVVGYITTPFATWSCLILLLSMHLGMNHRAVRAVSMHTLNRQRANLVFSHALADPNFVNPTIMSPAEVSSRERIFEKDGVLRWKGGPVMARVKIGASLQELASLLGKQSSSTKATTTDEVDLQTLLNTFKSETHLLWYSPVQRTVVIVLKQNTSAAAMLKAWAHALLLVNSIQKDTKTIKDPAQVLEVIQKSSRYVNAAWRQMMEAVTLAGWDVESASLEAISGVRLSLT